MEEIRRIPDPVSTPQPVGPSARKQPGRSREEFQSILDRNQGHSSEEDGERSQEDDATRESESSAENQAGIDEDRGGLLDERA